MPLLNKIGCSTVAVYLGVNPIPALKNKKGTEIKGGL